MRRALAPLRSEDGQVSLFVLGMTLVVLAVAGLAVDGTRAFLLRRTLQNAADSAALAGANALDENAYYASAGKDVSLDAGAARATAARWLARRGISASFVRADRSRTVVVVRGAVETTFLRLIGVRRVPVAVESVAAPVAGSP